MPSIRDVLKTVLLSVGVSSGGVVQGVEARNRQAEEDANIVVEYLRKLDKEMAEKDAEREKKLYEEAETFVLTPEDFGIKKPVPIMEEEDQDEFTRLDAYKQIKEAHPDTIDGKTAKFLIESLQKGAIKMEDIDFRHYDDLASSENITEAMRQDLIARYVRHYNENPNQVKDESLIDVLNSPMGKDLLSDNGGINLDIDVAERLIGSKKLNLDNVGKTDDTFRAYALDYTIDHLDSLSQNPKSFKDKEVIDNKLADYSYQYAQNGKIMGAMQKSSSLMGRYALMRVFDGHMNINNFVSDADRKIIKNVLDDATDIRHQDNPTAVGNYNNIAVQYGKLMPETYALKQELDFYCIRGMNEQYEGRKTFYENSTNAVLRKFLHEELSSANTKIEEGTCLDKEGTLLYRSRAFYNKSEAYQEYIDFSRIHQNVTGEKDRNHLTNKDIKISRESLKKDGWRDNQGNLHKYDDRQVDFGMYIYYRELQANKIKLTDEQRKDFEQIKSFYKEDHLDRMYDITAAVYSGNYNKAVKASEKISKEEGLSITVAYHKTKKTLRLKDYRDGIEGKADKCRCNQEEWNSVMRQNGKIYSQGNENAGGVNSVEDCLRSSKQTAQANTAQSPDLAATMSSRIAAAREKSVVAGRTKAPNQQNSLYIQQLKQARDNGNNIA